METVKVSVEIILRSNCACDAATEKPKQNSNDTGHAAKEILMK